MTVTKYKSKDYWPEPYEEVEQRAVVQLLEAYRLKFTAIPNSTFTKSMKQKKKNKEQGLRKGLPDLFILFKDRAIFLEMKRRKSGTVSKDQKEWIKAINVVGGNVAAHVACGYDEAKIIIDSYYKRYGK